MSEATTAGAARRRAGAIADALMARISGLPVGERLGTIAQLRQDFDVAAATMTEAVRLLEQRGVVTVRQGRAGGVFVALPSAGARLGPLLHGLDAHDDPDEVDELRRALEPAVIAAASRTAEPRDARELEFLLERLVARVGDDGPSFADAERALHRHVARLCANDLLRTVYGAVLDLDERIAPTGDAVDREAAVAEGRALVAQIAGAVTVAAARSG
jgi:DNA-binding FadR family transcriptional regulator